MKTKLLKNVLLLITLIAFTSQINAQNVTFSTGLGDWDISYGTNSVVTHAPTEGVNGDGALQLQRTGANANFGIKVAGAVTTTGIDATAKKFIRIRYKNGTKATLLQIGGKNGDGTTLKTDGNKNIQFSIFTPESDKYETAYIDLSDVSLWSGDIQNFHMLIKKNDAPVTDTDNFYLDEIEFLSEMPAVTYSEFIKNPSFDGPTGTAHLTGEVDFATRGLTTSQFHDGAQSLGLNFSADATKAFWSFTAYEKKYTSVYTAGSDIQIKMWVKTNRAAPIKVSTRVKLSLNGTAHDLKPIASVVTTNTAMGWEELTFNIEVVEDFDGIIFWFAVDWADETEGAVAENLNAGDMVYIDQMSAALTLDVLSVERNALEGVNVFVNQKTQILNVNAPLNAGLEMYNILGGKVKSIKKLNENNSVSVADMASGVYIVRVTSEGKSKTTKVIVR